MMVDKDIIFNVNDGGGILYDKNRMVNFILGISNESSGNILNG